MWCEHAGDFVNLCMKINGLQSAAGAHGIRYLYLREKDDLVLRKNAGPKYSILLTALVVRWH
jgi:hypothetical protein